MSMDINEMAQLSNAAVIHMRCDFIIYLYKDKESKGLKTVCFKLF